MEITWHTWDLTALRNDEDSLPRFFVYVDYLKFRERPDSRYITGKGLKREFVDKVYHHYFNFQFGIGKYGIYVEIKYKPFRYIPYNVIKKSEISGRLREKTEYRPEYL